MSGKLSLEQLHEALAEMEEPVRQLWGVLHALRLMASAEGADPERDASAFQAIIAAGEDLLDLVDNARTDLWRGTDPTQQISRQCARRS